MYGKPCQYSSAPMPSICPATLNMKGRWKPYINVWFLCMYSQKWNCYFRNRIIMFCLPDPTLIYQWGSYIFPGAVCLFFCREICGPILGIYKSLIDTWMWKLGLRPRNSKKKNTLMVFPLQCLRPEVYQRIRTFSFAVEWICFPFSFLK